MSTSNPPSAPANGYFAVPLPNASKYMQNVLATFVNGIPEGCYEFCTSTTHSQITSAMISKTPRPWLMEFVEERLRELANYEYREWLNGQQPFITFRELQLWRLRLYVQYLWFWNLPDDDDLAMIFNLTKRRAGSLAADFIARFRKTAIYPVALQRLYSLVLSGDPKKSNVRNNKDTAIGCVYEMPSERYLNTAEYLLEDLAILVPMKRMASPYLWDKEQYWIWIDNVMIDIMRTNQKVKTQLANMYPIP
jgi:hypothetical protein